MYAVVRNFLSSELSSYKFIELLTLLYISLKCRIYYFLNVCVCWCCHFGQFVFLGWFLGPHTVNVRAFCFGRHLCRLSSVLRLISKTKGGRREISSPLYEIWVAEHEYDVRLYTGSSQIPRKVSPTPKIVQNSVWAYCLTPLAMQLV